MVVQNGSVQHNIPCVSRITTLGRNICLISPSSSDTYVWGKGRYLENWEGGESGGA